MPADNPGEPTYTAEEVRVLLELRSLQEWKGVVTQALQVSVEQGAQLERLANLIERMTQTQEAITSRLIASTPEEAAAAHKGLQMYEQRLILRKWVGTWRGKLVIGLGVITAIIASISATLNFLRNLGFPRHR
jgi:hypothetical protein